MQKPKRNRGLDIVLAACLVAACVATALHLASRSGEQPDTDPNEGWTKLEPVATVEIADTRAKRTTGLMFRESMPADHGMYFTYPGLHRGSFYMRNTGIPLSIAFIRDDGVIIDLLDMQPFDETSVGPNMDYKDALEMNRGWFERNEIKIGDRARLEDAEVTFWRRTED